MTMSTQTWDNAAALLGAQVLVDDLLIGDVGQPVTNGINVERDFNFYSAAVEQRRNYLPNTDMQNMNNLYWGQFGAVASTLYRSPVVTPDGDGGHRQTFTSISGSWSIAAYGSRNNPAMPVGVAGQTVILAIRVRASRPGKLDVGLSYGSGSNTIGQGTYDIGPDPVDIFHPVVVSGAAVGQLLSMRLGMTLLKNANGWVVNDWVEYSRPMLTIGAWATPIFFDGDNGDSPTDTFDWSGIPQASASIMSTREATQPVKGLVQSVTLESAVDGRITQTYSIKVPRAVPLAVGQAVKVVSSRQEPALAGQVLLVDTVSKNGLALLRKATASIYKTVQQEGKGVIA